MSISSVSRQSVSPKLSIRVFGSFEISRDGNVLKARTETDLKVLAYLILQHGRSVGRAEVARASWEKDRNGQAMEPGEASRLLSRSLVALSRCLGEEGGRLVKPTPQVLLLDAKGADLDLLAWERALTGGVPELEQKAPLFFDRGLLVGWNDSWVVKAREQFKTDYLAALKSAALRAWDDRKWDNAIRGFELLFNRDPWYPDAVRTLLELLFERRRFPEMERRYKDFGERCKQQARSVDPELRDNYRSWQEAAKRFQASGENGWLPTPISKFVARPADVDEVGAILQSARLTTLTGTGGVGKTRLAIATAVEVHDLFYDRTWFVDLADVEDQALVPQRVAQVLRLKEHPEKSPTEVICEALRAKEALLVLDNCEHLLDACTKLVGQILEFCPTIKILTTSRIPLHIVGEAVWRVPSLECAGAFGPYLPEAIERFSSIRLLRDRASRPQRPFTIEAHNVDAVVRICRLLDGIPLAIELAAIQIDRRGQSVQKVLESLEQSLGFLTEGSAAARPRQQTLRAAISWSYDLLSETERKLFRRLAVFAGGFTAEATEQICSDALSSVQNVRDALQALVDQSLVEIRDSQQRRRYHLLQTIREFAQEQLERAYPSQAETLENALLEERAPTIRQRHLDYYVALIEKAEPNLHSAEQVIWFDLINDEHDNIRVALTWTLNQVEYQTGLRMASSMAWYWYTRDYHGEGAKWLETFLPLADTAPNAVRLKAIHWAGNIAYAQADFARARTFFEQGLEIRKQFGNQRSVAVGQASLANAVGALGDPLGALALLEASLAVFLDLGDEPALRNVGLSLTNMGTMAYALGDYLRARALHEESLRILHDIQDVEHVVLATNNLIGTLLMSNELETARTMLPQSLQLCLNLGSDHRLINCLINYIALATYERDWQRAAVIFGYEKALRDRIGYVLPKEAEERYLANCTAIQNHLTATRFRDLMLQGERATEKDLIELLLSI